jgi:light-regulated signal transduction histidine kinase (bacteriophytochrome)
MGRLAEPGNSRALFRRAPADPGGIADVSTKVDGAVEKSVKERISELLRDNLTLKREIIARDSTERELKRTINELERSNRELQEFAFVASHDLQAPLRKMQAFASLLDEEYGSALDEEARGYIHCMKGSAGKMRNLINRLLEYSRVNSENFFVRQVNLREVIQEVISDMQTSIEEEGGSVEVDVDAVAEVDPMQMRQLFQNLIHNAVKFRGNDAPVVKVWGKSQKIPARCGSETGTEMVEIRIEDKGIGFDEAFMTQVFAPFQRLHPQHEYAGTGMGLPICTRIVERHHGELTAKSQAGKGAVFIVRLPVTQPGKQDANG